MKLNFYFKKNCQSFRKFLMDPFQGSKKGRDSREPQNIFRGTGPDWDLGLRNWQTFFRLIIFLENDFFPK